ICKCNTEQAEPCPSHMMLVQFRDKFPCLVARLRGRTRETIKLSTNEMAIGMATECVAAQQNNVEQHDGIDKIEAFELPVRQKRVEGIPPQHRQNQHRQIEEITMQVLQNEWE